MNAEIPDAKLQSERQKKLDVKLKAEDHTVMDFGIEYLSIPLFSQHSPLFSGTITASYPFQNPQPDKFIWNDANTHVHVNVLQEIDFWPKTIRLTNAGTYNITH